jgi:hypothetical protein
MDANDYVEKAEDKLKESSEIHSNSRNKMCCVLLCIAIIVVALVIVFLYLW